MTSQIGQRALPFTHWRVNRRRRRRLAQIPDIKRKINRIDFPITRRKVDMPTTRNTISLSHIIVFGLVMVSGDLFFLFYKKVFPIECVDVGCCIVFQISSCNEEEITILYVWRKALGEEKEKRDYERRKKKGLQIIFFFFHCPDHFFSRKQTQTTQTTQHKQKSKNWVESTRRRIRWKISFWEEKKVSKILARALS